MESYPDESSPPARLKRADDLQRVRKSVDFRETIWQKQADKGPGGQAAPKLKARHRELCPAAGGGSMAMERRKDRRTTMKQSHLVAALVVAVGLVFALGGYVLQ